MNESYKKKLARIEYMGWSCGKMVYEKLAKRADAQKVEGKWRRVRPKLRWGIGLKVMWKEWEKNEKKYREN